MIQLITEYPFNNDYTLVKTYAIDELGNHYKIQQIQTGVIFDEAIDKFPPAFNYRVTEEKVPTIEELMALEKSQEELNAQLELETINNMQATEEIEVVETNDLTEE